MKFFITLRENKMDDENMEVMLMAECDYSFLNKKNERNKSN